MRLRPNQPVRPRKRMSAPMESRGHPARMATSSSSRGIARNASRMRIITASTNPPAYPAIAPYATPNVRLTTVASTPIRSESRAPYTTRLKTSRLYGSVPNGCANEGGSSFIATISGWAAGSYGAISGAMRPMKTIVVRIPRARREGRRSMIRANILPSDDSRDAAVRSAGTEPRIGPRVKHVGEEAAQHYHHAADDHRADDQWIIPGLDRVHQSVAHPRPREHSLDEHGSRQQRGK